MFSARSRDPQIFPASDLLLQGRPLPAAIRHARLDAEGGARPACVRKERIQSIERRAAPSAGCPKSGHHPAIRQARRTLQRGFGRSAEPDRNRASDGQRVEAGIGNGVPLALERDQCLRPQQAQQCHLLLEALAAVRKS